MHKKLIITTLLIIALAGVGVLYIETPPKQKLESIAYSELQKCKQEQGAYQAIPEIVWPLWWRPYACGHSGVTCCAARDFINGEISSAFYTQLLRYFNHSLE